MIFTDSEGREWEDFDIDESWDNSRVIRPKVKQEPKWAVRSAKASGFNWGIEIGFNGTYSQSERIKEAVEALMEYVNGDGRYTSELTEPAEIARQSMTIISSVDGML